MAIERKVFSGILNLDDPIEVVPGTHHKDSKNITFRGNAGEMRVDSIVGNREVTNANLQAGTNVCIGSHYDELKLRVFYFVYNSNGYDAIFVYNTINRNISTLLMSKVDSLESEPLFNFSPDFPIASINILYRTEADGDILHWTDRTNAPMKLNIKEAEAVNKTYNGNWKKKYLTVARPMPLLSPICKYENDNTVPVNNLKSKLYQFRYRWVYKDFTKSTWSPWSRLFAPEGTEGDSSLANEINPTKNNRISIKYQTGDTDVLKIEIASRQSLDSVFSDTFLVESVDKNGLPDNSEYEYKFYNNEAYQYTNQSESNVLFDYVPIKANSQELLNGNILAYGGITEGRTPGVNLAVSTALSLVQNTQTSTPLTMSSFNRYTFTYFPVYNVTGGNHYIILNGVPNVGDTYTFTISFRRDIGAGVQSTSVSITIPPLTSGQNTLEQLELILLNQLTSNATLQNYGLTSSMAILGLVEPGEFNNKRGVKIPGNSTNKAWVLDSFNYVYTYSGGGGSIPFDPTGANTSCYKHNSRYSFGVCYFDEYGVTNGVTTTENLKVITPELTSAGLGSSQLSIPMVQFTVTSQAPSWAKFFSFVRTENLTMSDFKTIISDETEKDVGGGFAYLAITKYQTNKSGYPAYSFTKGDRVRIVGRKTQAASIYDYSILSLVTSLEATITPADNIWIKIPYDSSWMSVLGTAGYDNYYLEIYTPALNASAENQLFYEFGETFPIIQDGVNRYHTGTKQNQTSSQGAIFEFFRGDVYNRYRDSVWILDKSMSDKYGSRVDGNGRAFVIDEYAKEAYYPTLLRYSLDYQSGTSINQTNKFVAANFDEYDRERGDIQRLKVRGRQLRVFQNRACGVVPILQSLVQTADGDSILSQSAQIINSIQYYLGSYGIGNQFCSLVSSSTADYFADPIRGAQVRLSNDGFTSITETYKGHYYLSPIISKYNKDRTHISGIGKAKIIGFYDNRNEEYVCIMQESTGSIPDKTSPVNIGFNERRNAYSSFYDFQPEWSECSENLPITFLNGKLYTHDDTVYCRFYGTQYAPYITMSFNQNQRSKKRYNSLTTLGNTTWYAPSFNDVWTSTTQYSVLEQSDFINREGKSHAAFKRDSTSTGGIYNGNVLKGNWLLLKLRPIVSNVYVNLYYVEINTSETLNNR